MTASLLRELREIALRQLGGGLRSGGEAGSSVLKNSRTFGDWYKSLEGQASDCYPGPMYCQLLVWSGPIINYNCYRPSVQCFSGSLVIKYIKAEAGATEATPQQVGGHARAMNLADLAAVDGACAISCPGRLDHRLPPRLFACARSPR